MQRCNTICILSVRASSDLLQRQLAREGVNLIFKKGNKLQQLLFNGEPKKIGGKMFVTESHASIVLSVTLERLLNGMKDNPNIREVRKTKIRTIVYTYI